MIDNDVSIDELQKAGVRRFSGTITAICPGVDDWRKDEGSLGIAVTWPYGVVRAWTATGRLT